MKTITITRTEYNLDKEPVASYVSAIHKYDEKKRVIEESEIDEEGHAARRVTYEYSEKGNVSAQTEYDDSGDMLQRLQYEENEKGEIIKQIHTFSDGSSTIKSYIFEDAEEGYTANVQITDDQGQALGTERIRLDKNDNIVLAVEFDDEGNESNKLERTYNEDGKLTQEAKYFSGEIEYIKRFTYSEKGKVELVKTLDGEGHVLGQETFTYNEKGQQLGNNIDNKVDNFSVQKEFEWDEKGNIILTTMYRDGRLLYQSKNEYDQNNELLSEDIVEMDWRSGRVERHEKLEYSIA